MKENLEKRFGLRVYHLARLKNCAKKDKLYEYFLIFLMNDHTILIRIALV